MDVNSIYPEYPEGKNSGFELDINKNEISSGTHKLKVEALGEDGSKIEEETTFNIKNRENKLFIDGPRGTIEDESIKVTGWSLNGSKTKE
ncbi:hypothetical protein LEQ06_17990, partial [Paraclostridium sp. AKS46]|nr:hypothetical protein [Paraclostridium sp. AKS46]